MSSQEYGCYGRFKFVFLFDHEENINGSSTSDKDNVIFSTILTSITRALRVNHYFIQMSFLLTRVASYYMLRMLSYELLRFQGFHIKKEASKLFSLII